METAVPIFGAAVFICGFCAAQKLAMRPVIQLTTPARARCRGAAERFGHRAAQLRIAESISTSASVSSGISRFSCASGPCRRSACGSASTIGSSGPHWPSLPSSVASVARSAAVERVKGQVDDLANIAFARRRFGHFFRRSSRIRFRQDRGERLLQPRGADEMVEQIGVGAVDAARHGFQCHRRRFRFRSILRARPEGSTNRLSSGLRLLHYDMLVSKP